MTFRIPAVALTAVLTACGAANQPNENSGMTPSEAVEMPTAAIYTAAIEHVDRSAADKERDVGRNPAAVLEFFGVAPEMDVLDLFSGGGYYSEILARVVGPDGTVTAHSNKAYADFVGEEAMDRLANNRLPNIDILMAENSALEFPDDAYDAAIMILAYHDIYLVDADNDWPKIDGPNLLNEIFVGLRPGGIFGVVDHVAAPGSPRETGGTLHRIDPEIVIAEVEAAGFILDGKSEVLRNKDDDHSLHMRAPEVSGKTDRFVFRFKKPE